MMLIINNSQITETQIPELDKLVTLCYQHDKGMPVVYRPLLIQKRMSDNNVLVYVDNKLVGFLSVFFFYEHACEVSLLVDPDHRGQKIAHQMIKRILPLLSAKEMEKIIFSILPSTSDEKLGALGFHYHNTEYHMQRALKNTVRAKNPSLIVRKATDDDLFALCNIDELCFKNHHSNLYVRLKNVLDDPKYTLLIAIYKKVAVGKAHIQWEDDRASLSDLAVLPQYQRQGLGSALVADCINHILFQGKELITLDVEMDNKKALTLYQQYDFSIINTNVYWAIELNKLIQAF